MLSALDFLHHISTGEEEEERADPLPSQNCLTGSIPNEVAPGKEQEFVASPNKLMAGGIGSVSFLTLGLIATAVVAVISLIVVLVTVCHPTQDVVPFACFSTTIKFQQ